MKQRFRQLMVLACVLACMRGVVGAQEEDGGGPDAEEAEYKQKWLNKYGSEPDFTKGGGAGNVTTMALGPTGIMGNIWKSRAPGKMAQVAEVLDGSPASGKLSVGDVIVGIGSGKIKSDVRRELSAAITEAEKDENGGKLVLNVWRKSTGKAAPVTLTLDVKGTYSDTSPWNCPKTEKLIDEAAEYLVNNMPGGIAGNVAVLGLLATGEKKYQNVVRERCRKAAQGGAGGPWNAGYKLTMLSEYYLATGDSSVKSGIKSIAERVARGQSNRGTYGHGYATPWGGESGYGAMNQCSIICNMGMLLATKCGINSSEVNKAVVRGVGSVNWYAEKGRVPYGYQTPKTEDYDSNGRTASSAILVDLYGDKIDAESFARCTLASYNDREGGHTGQYWSWLWGALGAARAGPEAAKVFCRETRWYTELERLHDGHFHYQPTVWKDTGKYKNWDTTGARLLQMCLPRKAIYLTGKGGSCFEPLTGQRLKETVAAATFDAKQCSVNELLDNLGSWSWRIRRESAMELGKRGGDVSSKVIAMLDSPDRNRFFGACMAAPRVGGRDNFSKVKDKLLHIIETSNDESMRYYALQALRCTSGKRGFGSAVVETAPDLMKLLVKLEAKRTDPWGRIPAEIVMTLWGGEGGYGGRISPGDFDANLVVAAMQAGMKNTSAKSIATAWLQQLDDKQLEKMWGDIWAVANRGSAGSQKRCQDAIARGHFKEGLELTVNDMTRKGWGGFKRIPMACATLAGYGANVKPYLPEITAAYKNFIANRKPNEVEHMQKSWAKLQENMNRKIELRSIKDFAKDVPDKTANWNPGAVPTPTRTTGSAPSVASKPTQTVPSVQKARSLSAENRAILDNALKGTLTKLSDSGALKEVPIGISLTRAKVWLKSVAGEKLTFQVVGGSQTAPFKWKDLGPADRATLGMLVAALKPDSPDAQAMAGVYLESMGRVKEADRLFDKAGEDSSKKLQKLLE